MSVNYSFYRAFCGEQGSIPNGGSCGTAGRPVDNNDNSTDFLYVETNGTNTGAGQRLGAPGPENLSSPVRAGGAASLVATPLDSFAAAAAAPNASRDRTSDPANNSAYGTLALRARVRNSSGAVITRLRFPVIDAAVFPSPAGVADLRARTSESSTVAGVNDPAACGGLPAPCAVVVQGTTLEAAADQPAGGGFNSSLSAGAGTTIHPGAAANLQFLFGVEQQGAYRICVAVETLPATASDVLCFSGYTDGPTATPTPTPSARLASLTVKAGALYPDFSPSTFGYSMAQVVADGVAVTAVPATPSSGTAQMQVSINGGPFESLSPGQPSPELQFSGCVNFITVRVTEPSANISQDYTVSVTRAQCAQGPQGPQGPAGPTGRAGPVGPAGVSGYELVTGAPVAIGKQASGTATAACPAGKRVIGGGFSTGVPAGGSAAPYMINVYASRADGASSWSVTGFNPSNISKGTQTLTLTAYAVCASVQ